MSSMNATADLKKAVEQTLARVRSVEREQGVNRDAIAKIKELLVDLTKQRDLFGTEHFPMPTAEKPASIYLLSEDSDHRFAMYLVCASPGTQAPPHDHTTWAVIAGLDGEEENRIYERVDDGSIPGRGEVKEIRRVVLGQGDGIAFMPDDIHSIKAVSPGPTRHFHLYGKSFDEQTERVAYNQQKGTYQKMPTGMLPVDDSRRVN